MRFERRETVGWKGERKREQSRADICYGFVD
jgi:hypothetical protein